MKRGGETVKIKTFKDKDDERIYLKIRHWDRPEEFWFDVWRKDEVFGEVAISKTVALSKRQVKSMIKFLERLLR